MLWYRSENGVFLGVCEGLGESFKIEPWLLRFALLIAIFFFGTGLLIYFCLGFTLPRRDRLMEAKEAKLLGVCYRLSQNSNMDIGLIRFLFLFLTLLSGGAIFLIYFILHFVLKPVDDDIII